MKLQKVFAKILLKSLNIFPVDDAQNVSQIFSSRIQLLFS